MPRGSIAQATRPGRPLAAVLCGMLILAPEPGRAAAGTLPPPHDVKAAYLLHFARFVEWPPHALAGRPTLDVCVLGDDPLHRSLEAAARDGTVAARKVAPARVATPLRIERCHVLFVADTFHGDMEEMLPVVQRAHVLLVGEGRAFLVRGGTIAFVREGRRVRFDVHLGAAERAGLKLRSQLVKLARHVTRSDGG